jgi:nucleoside-diphosphate-sugar epimerase
MKLLITGASGFIGRAICARLSEVQGMELIATVRSAGREPLPVQIVKPGILVPDSDWRDALDSVDVVVHAAALAHVIDGAGNLADYRRVNVEGTLNLARQAAACGVRRFVFLSSVKVNGEGTLPGQKFRAEDPPAPVDPYGISKHEAEIGLRRLRNGCDMEVVAIRPALVYGAGVKGYLPVLMRWVRKGYPLPFAGIRNARSLVALENLVKLIGLCCEHPLAADNTFMAADEKDISTTELITRLGAALGKPAKLFPAPSHLLLALGSIAGKRREAEKMLGSLQVDSSRTRQLLGWKPEVGMDQALAEMARDFLERCR